MIGDKLDIDDTSVHLWRHPQGYQGCIATHGRTTTVYLSNGLVLADVDSRPGRFDSRASFFSHVGHLICVRCNPTPIDDFADAARQHHLEGPVRAVLEADYNDQGNRFDIQTTKLDDPDTAIDELVAAARNFEDQLGPCTYARGRMITSDIITERIPHG